MQEDNDMSLSKRDTASFALLSRSAPSQRFKPKCCLEIQLWIRLPMAKEARTPLGLRLQRHYGPGVLLLLRVSPLIAPSSRCNASNSSYAYIYNTVTANTQALSMITRLPSGRSSGRPPARPTDDVIRDENLPSSSYGLWVCMLSRLSWLSGWRFTDSDGTGWAPWLRERSVAIWSFFNLTLICAFFRQKGRVPS